MVKINILLLFIFLFFLPSRVRSGDDNKELAESIKLREDILETEDLLDAMWILLNGILVFFMQAGFACLEVGSVRVENTQHILSKNLMNTCISIAGFYFIGYGLAFRGKSAFIGAPFHWWSKEEVNFGEIFFYWTFTANAGTIVSGCIAERTKLKAYFIFSLFISTCLFPVVVHMVWYKNGWLYAHSNRWNNTFIGMIDFAGSGVVHMVGGFSGLIGAIVVGPRVDRFSNKCTFNLPGQNSVLQTLGCCILWFSWYGFNAGSSMHVSNEGIFIVARVCVNTTLSGACGFITCCAYVYLTKKTIPVGKNINGLLSGLVSITGGCAVVQPWAACVIGTISAFVYLKSSDLLTFLHIDDPLDAASVHGFVGAWGVIATGIFLDPSFAEQLQYTRQYSVDYHIKQIISQLIGVICILGTTVALSTMLFLCIDRSIGMRVSVDDEMMGLDMALHCGLASEDKIKYERFKKVTRQKNHERRKMFFIYPFFQK